MDWSVRHKLLLLGALKRCGPEDWSGVAGLLSTHPWFEPPVLEEKCRLAYMEITENFSEINFDSSSILDQRYNLLISTLHKEYTEVLKTEIEATKEKLNSLYNQTETTKKPSLVPEQELPKNDFQPLEEVLTNSEQESQTPLPTEEILVPLTDGLICSDIKMGLSAKPSGSATPPNSTLNKEDIQQNKLPLYHPSDILQHSSTSSSGLPKVKDKENIKIFSEAPQKALSIQHKRTVAQPLRLSPLKKRLVNYSYRGLPANLLESQEIHRISDSNLSKEKNPSNLISPKKVILPVVSPLVLESLNDTKANSLSEEASFLDSSILQNENVNSLEQPASPHTIFLPCSPGVNISEKAYLLNEENFVSKNELTPQDLCFSELAEISSNIQVSGDKDSSNFIKPLENTPCLIFHSEEKSIAPSGSPLKKRLIPIPDPQSSAAGNSNPLNPSVLEEPASKPEQTDNCTELESLESPNPLKRLRFDTTPGLEMLIQDDLGIASRSEGELLEDLEGCEIDSIKPGQINSPEASALETVSETVLGLPLASSVEHEALVFGSTDLVSETLDGGTLETGSKGLSLVSQLKEVPEISESKDPAIDESNGSNNPIIDESRVSIGSVQGLVLPDASVDSCSSSLNTAGGFAGEDNSPIPNLPVDASVVSNSFDTNIVSSPLTIKDDSSVLVGTEPNIEELKTSVLKDELFPSDQSNHSPSPEPQEIYNRVESEASLSSSSSFKDDCSNKSLDVPKLADQANASSEALTKKHLDSSHNLTIDVIAASGVAHPSTEEAMYDRIKLDSPGYKKWKKLAFIVFKEIANHRLAPIFQRPIKESVAPGYFSIVKCPMDLTTIQNRIKQGIITTTDEFSRDLLLMCGNALMFNRADSEIYGMAKEMLKSVEMHLKTLHAADLYHSSTPAAPTPQPESAHSFS